MAWYQRMKEVSLQKPLVMISPAYPINEQLRQETLTSYKLLDSPTEVGYDNITKLAAYICDAPIALITMLDGERNWFKSKVGIPFCESPRAISFCGHAIQQPHDIMIVTDARKDVRFHDNPLVTEHSALFYCGIPILSANGQPLGTLCVFDTAPRHLNDNQIDAMKSLANQVQELLARRKQALKAQTNNEKLAHINNMLRDFAAVAAHDLKLPIASIITTTDILKKQYKEVIDLNGIGRLDMIKTCSLTLSNYISSMLEFYSSGALDKKDFVAFRLQSMLNKVVTMMIPENDCELTLPEGAHVLNANELALMQIFSNLISNSIKYNDKEVCAIKISFREDIKHYHFSVEDNGQGIPEDKLATVFDIFKVASETDKHDNKGTGIGLATVKRLVNLLGGEISISSILSKSTTVHFSIKKPSRFFKN